ncbi:MAG TPA: glutamyl-tRNA reductase [Bacteroidia bacterium]|nr:glutamyl-tRNA reductase [Bacteroidia bacterium]
MILRKISRDTIVTEENSWLRPLPAEKQDLPLHLLKTIAFTHRHTPLKELDRFFLHEENRKERLAFLKYATDISEILYVSTCNRIEFIFTTHLQCDKKYLSRFFRNFREDWTTEEIEFAVEHAQVYEGEEALRHIYRVASSLDSLVVGEREIITQVRKSYDTCNAEGLTGDLLRLVVKSTITTAKKVYTETKIANNPVSVVSLAERKLREFNLAKNARILLVGSGETNSNLVKYLVKQGFKDFAIFNRTETNAKILARQTATAEISATAHALTDLHTYKRGFDVMITCTGSANPVITPEIYKSLLQEESNQKILIDLAVPADIHPDIIDNYSVALIDISQLRAIADKNMEERQSEFMSAEEIIDENIQEFRHLHRTRSLELKMKEVPEKIREIKDRALNDVFAKEIEGMDEKSKELLGKVLDYMEKKCISVPMVLAKEIILETSN